MKTNLIYMPAFSLLAALAMPVPLGAQTQPPRYEVTDLGTLGGAFSTAYSLNYAGRAGGNASLPDGSQHAFLTGVPGTMYDLGTLGGPNSGATGPNANYQLAIVSEISKMDPLKENFCGFGTPYICVAALWNGAMTPFPTLGGNNAQALAINNRGQLAGIAETGTRDPTCQPPQVLQYEAALWGPNPGQVQLLPPLTGDTVGFTFALNNYGQAVGSTGTCANTPLLPLAVGPHAVIWNNGVPTALTNLGGSMVGVGAGINDQGVIVGGSDLPNELPGFPFVQIHSTMWTPGGGAPQDLGTVGSDFSSLPTIINNNGQVVGASCDIMGNCRAFLWQNKIMTDLNALTPANSPLYLLFAQSINDSGEIVGSALEKNTGETHAFLATPIHTAGAKASFGPAAKAEDKPRALPEDVRQMILRQLGRRGH